MSANPYAGDVPKIPVDPTGPELTPQPLAESDAALDHIDHEIAWWEAKSQSMKHPHEKLALACAIGAITALQHARSAIADRNPTGGDAKQAPSRSDESGGAEGNRQNCIRPNSSQTG